MAEQQAEVFADVSELGTVAEKIEQQESAVKEEPKVEAKPKSIVEDIFPPELLDEFKGKSPEELARITLHARREMGKQANELGEVRRLADELIKSTLTKPKEQEVSNEIDLFENPQEYVRRAVESSPTVKKAADYAAQAQQELAKQRLVQLHPDVNQVVSEQGFQEWIGKSPVRQQLFKQANEFDVDAANELLSTYKELRGARQTAISETEKAARDKAMTAASVDTGGSGEKSKKVFRRSDLMKLMIKDRRKYESMQNEIAQAYLEGRVK